MHTLIAMHISVPTVDMTESVHFYCDLLGLAKVSESEGLTQLALGSHRVSLKQVSRDSSSLQRGGDRGVRARHFGFKAAARDDVDAVARRLKGHYPIVASPFDRGGERTFFCLDPSGNQVEIYCDD